MANSTQYISIILAGYFDIGPVKYLIVTILTLLYIAIILANTLLIGVIYVERTLHEPMYFFLCSLSVNNLYGSTALFPVLLVHIISKTHEVSMSYCFTQIFCLYTYALVEFSNLAVMAYDRYIAICYPLQYNSIMTNNIMYILIFLVWLYCFVEFTVVICLTARLELCGNVIERVYCDNYLIVKLACSNTTVNNIFGLIGTIVSLGFPLMVIIFSYIKILNICLKATKETKQKAMSTCTPHLASLLNFSLGCFFEILQSRFNNIQMPTVLRIFISVYFLMCPPLLNPIMYGIGMTKIRNVCKKIFNPVKLFPHNINLLTNIT